jgi:hypothetical protein
MFLQLTFAYVTINLPFNILNDGKTLYGTGEEIIQHYHDFYVTMDMIERMETTIRLNQSGLRF